MSAFVHSFLLLWDIRGRDNPSKTQRNILAQLLCPGVTTFVDLLQPGTKHMSVYLGRRNVRMTQHQLHGSQVRTVFQKVRCKGMPHHVWSQFLTDARLQSVSSQDLPETHSRHGLSTLVQEQILRMLLSPAVL